MLEVCNIMSKKKLAFEIIIDVIDILIIALGPIALGIWIKELLIEFTIPNLIAVICCSVVLIIFWILISIGVIRSEVNQYKKENTKCKK